MSEELREAARLSPDGALVAVRRGPNDWRVSNGGHYRDVHVADWTPLTALPELAALIADREQYARWQRAAAVLRAAAQEQRNEAENVPDTDEGTHADGHRCAAEFLDRRADALTREAT